jgi:F0F1-type ATP synthase assembly protein I
MPSDESGGGENASGNPAGNSGDKNNWAQMADYAQLAFVFPAATVVGWLVGAGLDKWLHTTWLYIGGLLLGIVAGFVELIRTVSKNT